MLTDPIAIFGISFSFIARIDSLSRYKFNDLVFYCWNFFMQTFTHNHRTIIYTMHVQQLTFQLLVNPGMMKGLFNPRNELREWFIVTASFSFTSERITLALLELISQLDPELPKGLRQKMKEVSQRLSPVVHASSDPLSSQHANLHLVTKTRFSHPKKRSCLRLVYSRSWTSKV